MPTMQEIYLSHSFEYDELVNHEDYKGHLTQYLLDNFDFKGKSVLEFGAGTGRMTKIYGTQAANIQIFDRSEHMLEKAKINLTPLNVPLSFSLSDNLLIDNLNVTGDLIIQGWSFGHTVTENPPEEETVDRLVSACIKRLNPGGTIILVESLGTGREEPGAPTESLARFHKRLENTHSFHKKVLSTDYHFSSNEEAERITGYFFGENFRKNLTFAVSGVVKEYTGVWSWTSP
jgi:SAM-dependent methyltransferase